MQENKIPSINKYCLPEDYEIVLNPPEILEKKQVITKNKIPLWKRRFVWQSKRSSDHQNVGV